MPYTGIGSHVDKVYYPNRKVGSDKRSLGGSIQILDRFRVALHRHWLNSLEPFDRTNQNRKRFEMLIDKLWILFRLEVWLIGEKCKLGAREQE